MKIRIASCFIGMLLGMTSQSFAAAVSSTEQFVSISDIHFNPFSSCKGASPTACPIVEKLRAAKYQDWDNIFIQDGEEELAKAGEETNYPLFASTLETLLDLEQEKHPAFGVVLGDLLAHEFRARYMAYSHDFSAKGYEEFVNKTYQFVAYKLHETLPTMDIYGVLGNNDSYNGDYSVTPNGLFYADAAKMWANLTNQPNNKKEILKSFPAGGYYAVTLPDKNTRLIALNTVLFSAKVQGDNHDVAAKQELAWLHEQLLSAAQMKQHVLLVAHISPGMDVYHTVKTGFREMTQFWQPAYQETFMAELQGNAAIITGMLSGHIHMDTFQVIDAQQAKIPLSFTPSISPMYGNNPGFKLYSMNPEKGILKDFDAYYLQDNSSESGWKKEYSFNQVYQPNCKQCDLISGFQTITPNSTAFQYYRQYYAVNTNAQPISEAKNWPAYWCDLHEMNATSYRQCADEVKMG